MALTYVRVKSTQVGTSGTVRLDPRYHHLRQLASPVIDSLIAPTRLDALAQFSNGVNLPRAAYADDDEGSVALYASVAPLASFTFRRAAAVPLRLTADGDRVAGTMRRVAELAVNDREVLITRSRASAPGLAWPGDLAPENILIIPAGFLIRADLGGSTSPCYVAAVLNHPVWRLLTAALAAGKSQDNLSQELLAGVPVPMLSREAEVAAAERYAAALEEISRLYEDEAEFAGVCDRVLAGTLGLPLPALPNGNIQVARISLSAIASTRGLRFDNRWHGPVNAAVRSMLHSKPTTALSTLLAGQPAKGRHPKWAAEEAVDDDTPLAVTTITIQSGTIAWDQAKPTTTQSVSRFPVRNGDLLVAMDGDGSLGKAAVYYGDVEGTVDSHVARCTIVGGPAVADAVSCFLNSTWGRVQTTALMTGSTGQTQLSPSDLSEVLMPADLASRSQAVARGFHAALRTYEPVARRARSVMCETSADLTTLLIREGALAASSKTEPFTDAGILRNYLDRLYPRRRQ